MHQQLNRLALCLAMGLCIQPALADDDDPTPRLCDQTAPHPTYDGNGFPHVDAAEYCPAGKECYVGMYPADVLHVPDGYCTVSMLRGDMKYVIFLAEKPPTSILRCAEVSSCETACASYPSGEGITHDWSVTSTSSAFSAANRGLAFATSENTILVTHSGPDSVRIRTLVTSPFERIDSSSDVRSPDPSCGMDGHTDPIVVID